MFAGPGRAANPDADCLACHGEHDLRSDTGASLFVDAGKRAKSAHAAFSCADCHEGIKEYPHPSPPPRVACATCHDDAASALAQSVHARANGGAEAPDCRACHGTVHEFPPRGDVQSPVAKRNLPRTCGACHASPDFLARHQLGLARPIEAFDQSVHGRELAKGNEKAASCSDCHGEHAILAPSEPGSLVSPARVSSVTCGRCHADERLAETYTLPRDKVPAFRDSFHGLAGRAGSQSVANCASCHGVHNILPSKDPRSSVHMANLMKTCGACHPGAGRRFAIGPVHVTSATETEHPVTRFVRVAYLTLIPATVGFMLLHNGLDFLRKLWRGVGRHASGETLLRMNLHFRIAHALVVLSFPALVVTGFALKYPEAWWAAPLVALEGSWAFRGNVHRIAAVLLCAACMYHVLHLVLVKRDRRMLRRLLPRAKDASDVAAFFRWAMGRREAQPGFSVFSYAEKMEYWAFVWGTAVMAVSGFILWFENWSLRLFPTWVTDAATAIHWYEAILATLAILVWHFYMVVFDPDVYPMDRAWLTGRASAEHLRTRRPVYERVLRRRESSKSNEG